MATTETEFTKVCAVVVPFPSDRATFAIRGGEDRGYRVHDVVYFNDTPVPDPSTGEELGPLRDVGRISLVSVRFSLVTIETSYSYRMPATGDDAVVSLVGVGTRPARELAASGRR